MVASAFTKILEEYGDRVGKVFAADDLSHILTETIPESLLRLLGTENKYLIKASTGQGVWAETPWAAILNPSVTTSTQRGYYVCYLLNPSAKLLYLCLAVGWTQFEEAYSTKTARVRIKEYSDYLSSQLKYIPPGFMGGPIDLSARRSLSKGYEQGQILSKCYEIHELDDKLLARDLVNILNTYDELVRLVGNDIQNVDYEKISSKEKLSTVEININKVTLEKDLDGIKRALTDLINDQPPRKRKVIVKKAVRNQKIAQLVKESQGYICELCGREPFIQKNGNLYAEADHVNPLGSEGFDSPDNMRCLCAQCHAVVTYGNEEEVRKILTK